MPNDDIHSFSTLDVSQAPSYEAHTLFRRSRTCVGHLSVTDTLLTRVGHLNQKCPMFSRLDSLTYPLDTLETLYGHLQPRWDC